MIHLCRLVVCRTLIPSSPNESALTGLNLLRLLVQNRIAEFHTELEVIPTEVGRCTDSVLLLRCMRLFHCGPKRLQGCEW